MGDTRGVSSRSLVTKCTSKSLTSKLMFLSLRSSSHTDVYRGKKLLGGSHESLDAAKPFYRTLYTRPPGLLASDLSEMTRSAVYSSSSPSSAPSKASGVNSKGTARSCGFRSHGSN